MNTGGRNARVCLIQCFKVFRMLHWQKTMPEKLTLPQPLAPKFQTVGQGDGRSEQLTKLPNWSTDCKNLDYCLPTRNRQKQ